MKKYKDKGAKKKGFKKSYHKVEWGDKKKYHNNFRNKKWKKKFKKWKKKGAFKKGKKYKKKNDKKVATHNPILARGNPLMQSGRFHFSGLPRRRRATSTRKPKRLVFFGFICIFLLMLCTLKTGRTQKVRGQKVKEGQEVEERQIR